MPLFFTHIQKTAGTSFKKSVIYPNIAAEKIMEFMGMTGLLKARRKPFDFLDGHYPYGVHRLVPSSTPVIYLTVLREPLDRAVSLYHFVKQCDTPYYSHPELANAKRFDIARFFALERYRNAQTKFVAGMLFMNVSRLLPGLWSQRLMLQQAKHNLANNYRAFGLFDRITEFQDTVAAMMGWPNLGVRDETKRTRNRPKVLEVPEATRAILAKSNQLDVDLYDFAAKLYEQRRGTGARSV
jgi:hypothetical protein